MSLVLVKSNVLALTDRAS